MKTRESGMPPEEMWQGFFDPPAILRKLGLTEQCGNVLEVGCGYGTFTVPAARIVQGTVYVVEIEPEMLATTRIRTEAAELSNVELRQRDFTENGSGLPDGSVDYVMLFNILHADERMQILNESMRVLNPNGKLAIIHWNYDVSTPCKRRRETVALGGKWRAVELCSAQMFSC